MGFKPFDEHTPPHFGLGISTIIVSCTRSSPRTICTSWSCSSLKPSKYAPTKNVVVSIGATRLFWGRVAGGIRDTRPWTVWLTGCIETLFASRSLHVLTGHLSVPHTGPQALTAGFVLVASGASRVTRYPS